MNDPVTIGAFATICAALVGAIATIVAAVISRRRLFNNQHHAELDENISVENHPLGDGVFRVRENSAIIISDLELTIAIRLVILDDQVNFEYRNPNMEKPFFAKNAEVGFQKLLEHQGKTYTLTIIKIDGVNKDVFFDLRKVLKTSIPPVEKPVQSALISKLPAMKKGLEDVEIIGTCPFCGAQYTAVVKPRKCTYCGRGFS